VALLNQPMELHIDKDTQLFISLAARPGNVGTRFHNFLYRELGLNFIYKAFTTRDIGSAIGGIRALGIRGCAISMPFKEAGIEYLDELDASAKGDHVRKHNRQYRPIGATCTIYAMATHSGLNPSSNPPADECSKMFSDCKPARS
jgi:shikimate dehydrogenase-like protein